MSNRLLVKDHKLGIQYKVTIIPEKEPGCLPLLKKQHVLVRWSINIHRHDISVAGASFWGARMLLICMLVCIHLHSLSICKIKCS